MVKTETSNEVVVLLTGEGWTGKGAVPGRGETHRATRGVSGGLGYLAGGWGWDPVPGAKWAGVEVPYLIGQKVRLTGSSYGGFIGEESEVVKYRVSGGFWVAVLENLFEVYSDEDTGEDWSVTPVVGADAPPPLEDWETRLIEHDKKEGVRKEVETEIVAYLRRVETEIRDDIQELLYTPLNPDLARLKEYAAEAHAFNVISEIVATGEYRD